MRSAFLVVALLTLGCAKKDVAVPPKPLKTPEEVTGVVKEGWSEEQVLEACGGPKERFPMDAPNADTKWIYDIPADKPTHRVQVFFKQGRLTTTATIPFSDAPSGPSR